MFSPQLTFVVATENDLPVFEGLAREGMASYYAIHQMEWKSEIFLDGYRKTENYKIERNECNVGVLRVSLENDHVYVYDLHVQPSVRNQGIGTEILAFVENLARRENKSHVRMCAFKTNSAINLYQRFGFKIVGEDDRLVKLKMNLVALNEPAA